MPGCCVYLMILLQALSSGPLCPGLSVIPTSVAFQSRGAMALSTARTNRSGRASAGATGEARRLGDDGAGAPAEVAAPAGSAKACPYFRLAQLSWGHAFGAVPKIPSFAPSTLLSEAGGSGGKTPWLSKESSELLNRPAYFLSEFAAIFEALFREDGVLKQGAERNLMPHRLVERLQADAAPMLAKLGPLIWPERRGEYVFDEAQVKDALRDLQRMFAEDTELAPENARLQAFAERCGQLGWALWQFSVFAGSFRALTGNTEGRARLAAETNRVKQPIEFDDFGAQPTRKSLIQFITATYRERAEAERSRVPSRREAKAYSPPRGADPLAAYGERAASSGDGVAEAGGQVPARSKRAAPAAAPGAMQGGKRARRAPREE